MRGFRHDVRNDTRVHLAWKRPQKKRREDELQHWVERSTLPVVGAIGAGAMYLFDPAMGRRRRSLARDRSAGAVRRVGRRLGRVQRRVTADAYGLSQKLTHLRHIEDATANDADLAQRVESMIFRDPTVPKGKININVEHGVAVLRGQLDRPEQIRDLEDAARKVPGIKDVESLLHLPNTPPANTQAAMDAE